MENRFNGAAARWSRRGFLARGSMAFASAALLAPGRVLADEAKAEFLEVKTSAGRIRGARGKDLLTFKGIPYAGSVAGHGRFKAPPAVQPWTGVRDALTLGAPSPQPGRGPFGGYEPAPAEDCLFLNVWTPAADRRKRPVMFYSHGGGFTTGSGGAPYQDGGNLARAWDVVVVATNHRLGLMGFLYLGELGGEEYATSGNQGLLDICAGLKWVRDNIEAFGGDPDNVMIFGESGGGAKTSCLYAMPAAAPYFNKASIESGAGIRMMPRDAAAETTQMVLRQLGLEKSEWRKLLEVPLDKLVEVQAELGKRPDGGPLTPHGGRKGIAAGSRPGGFGPVVEGRVLPRHPFDPTAPEISKDKPLIAGWNHDETEFFFMQAHDTEAFSLTDASLKARLDKELGANAGTVLETYKKSRPEATPSQIYVAITSAQMFGNGAIALSELKAAQHGAPVYMYLFTHRSEFQMPGTNYKFGAAHAGEIQYKFNNILESLLEGANPGMAAISGFGPDAVKAAHNMSQMWSTFARTGKPGATGQPDWPAYTLDRRATMEIDTQCKVVDDPYGQERALWEKLDA